MKLQEPPKELVDILHNMGLDNDLEKSRFVYKLSEHFGLGILKFEYNCDDMLEGCYIIPKWICYNNQYHSINHKGETICLWDEGDYYTIADINDVSKRNHIIEECRKSLSSIKESLIENKISKIKKDFE